MYHPRSKEDDAQCNNLWSWAHTGESTSHPTPRTP